MSTTTERPHAEITQDLKHHLAETLEQFGEAMERQAEECRAELASALVDTGRRLASSVTPLRAGLRRQALRVEQGAATATARVGRGLLEAGARLGPRRIEAPYGERAGHGVEATHHHVPASQVVVTQTLPGTGFIRTEDELTPTAPDEARDPAQRDSQAA